MSHRLVRSAGALMLVLAASAQAAAQIEVTACGQEIPAGEAAFLSGDLDCSGFGGNGDAAVYLDKNAALDLGGFTLTGAFYGIACGLPCGDGLCTAGTCKVRNGRVTAARSVGILADRISVANVTVDDNGGDGVGSYYRAKVIDSTISNNGDGGVQAEKVLIARSTITDHARHGVVATSLRIKESTLTGNDTSAECATDDRACADIFSATRPRGREITCDKSLSGEDGSVGNCYGWCMCADDQQ